MYRPSMNAKQAAFGWVLLLSIFSLVHYTQGQACSSSSTMPTTLTVTDSLGAFTTPGYPGNYSASVDCYYLFTPEDGYGKITLSITSFDLETSAGCVNDKFEVIDGSSASSTVLGTLCGSMANIQSQSLTSISNAVTDTLFVHFHTDSVASTVGTGVVLNYSAEKDSTSLSTGVIIAIAVSASVFVILLVVIIVVCVLKKKQKEEEENWETDTDDDDDLNAGNHPAPRRPVRKEFRTRVRPTAPPADAVMPSTQTGHTGGMPPVG